MKKLLLILLISPLIGWSQQDVDKIDSIINSKFNNGPAVSVLITQNFTPIYSKIKGNSDVENHLLAEKSTKFRIGSVTKQFTAIAILKLMEEGKLKLNDPIQNYLSNFPIKEHPITIEHLLTHTSGLAEITEMDVFYTQLMKNGCHPDSLVNYFKNLPLNFTPGSEFRYNNSGYHLLGLIVEKASGMNYNDFISKNLLQDAEMRDTRADRGSELVTNRASGYEELNGQIVNATYIDMSIPFSAGNLLSTTNDLNKWYKALFEYKIVSKKNLDLAHTRFQLNDGSYTNYGYGWFVDSLQGEKLISHEGGINGFLSSVWYIPSQKVLTVVLSNCMCNPTANSAKKITAHAIGRPIPENRRIQLPESTLVKYVGIYEMDEEEWIITLRDGELFFQFENGNGHPIYPLSENEFFAEEWDSEFMLYDKEDEIEFHFIYLGGEIIGNKIKDVHNSK